jgi:hypothetical protein
VVLLGSGGQNFTINIPGLQLLAQHASEFKCIHIRYKDDVLILVLNFLYEIKYLNMIWGEGRVIFNEI